MLRTLKQEKTFSPLITGLGREQSSPRIPGGELPLKPLVRSALKSPVNSKVKTILVVDDEEGIRRLLTGYFRRQGYRVLKASNSAEAFHICKTQPGGVQILMTDILMPGVNGHALAEQILLIW